MPACKLKLYSRAFSVLIFLLSWVLNYTIHPEDEAIACSANVQ